MESAVIRVGGALLELPFVRLTMLPTPLELHLSKRRIEEGGFSEDSVEPLAHIPSALPQLLRLLCVLFLLESKNKFEDVVSAWREVSRTLLKLYIRFLKPIYHELEEHGIDSLMNREPKGYWCPQQLLFESLVLKYAVLSAISSGVEEGLIEEGARIAFTLEKAALFKYRGIKREGCDLISWAKKFKERDL